MSSLEDADQCFRRGFAKIATTALERYPFTKDNLYERVRPRLAQGNMTALRDLAQGKGWIHGPMLTEIFRELGLPNADALGTAYQTLREAVNGKTEPTYRSRTKRFRQR